MSNQYFCVSNFLGEQNSSHRITISFSDVRAGGEVFASFNTAIRNRRNRTRIWHRWWIVYAAWLAAIRPCSVACFYARYRRPRSPGGIGVMRSFWQPRPPHCCPPLRLETLCYLSGSCRSPHLCNTIFRYSFARSQKYGAYTDSLPPSRK